MKQTQLITVLLVSLILFGGISTVMADSLGKNKQFSDHEEKAEEYMKRDLFQKAIQEYEAAEKTKVTEELTTKKMEAYTKLYAEDKDVFRDFLNSAERAVQTYPDNSEYLDLLVQLYKDEDNYSSAYYVLNKAVRNGMDDKHTMSLLDEVKYAYELEWKSYDSPSMYVNGYYAVCSDSEYEYITKEGKTTNFSELEYAGPVGEKAIRFINNEKKQMLIDDDEVIQGYVKDSVESAGVYAEGLIPLMSGKSVSYYDLLGDKQFGDYTAAGTFQNGEAAVCKNNQWFLINDKGEQTSKETFEEIRLTNDGLYEVDGVMLVKKNGKYHLLKKDKSIGDYDDVDILTEDGLIAVCINGKWGFVDTEGKEIVKPQYSEAKSFCNGLAAVSNGNEWGFINQDGKLVIDYQFYGADYFNKAGNCLVETGKGTNWQLLKLKVNL